ncbi:MULTISPECIES: hypothetical protein [Paenibacillus]|nr:MULTISPECIES: hypothetical protein [Paenibacillus]
MLEVSGDIFAFVPSVIGRELGVYRLVARNDRRGSRTGKRLLIF